jgi:hypothetical protein
MRASDNIMFRCTVTDGNFSISQLPATVDEREEDEFARADDRVTEFGQILVHLLLEMTGSYQDLREVDWTRSFLEAMRQRARFLHGREITIRDMELVDIMKKFSRRIYLIHPDMCSFISGGRGPNDVLPLSTYLFRAKCLASINGAIMMVVPEFHHLFHDWCISGVHDDH